MSKASKSVFAITCGGSMITILYVHYKQQYDQYENK